MKFLFATLAIAVMIQVSLAGSLRFKRDEEVKKGVEEFMKISKQLVEASETLIKETLKEIPATDAYKPYRADLEEILKDIQEAPATPGSCFFKTFGIMFEFLGFIGKYAEDGISEEDKFVFDLLDKHDTSNVDKVFEAFQEKYSDKKIDPKIEKMSKAELLESIKPLFTEVC